MLCWGFGGGGGWWWLGCLGFFGSSEGCFVSVDLQMKLRWFFSWIFFQTGRPKVSIIICKSRGILSASLQIIKLWRSSSVLSLHLYHPTDFGNYPFFFHLPNKLSQTYSFSSKLHVPVKMKAVEGTRCKALCSSVKLCMTVHDCGFGQGSYFIFLQLLLHFDS